MTMIAAAQVQAGCRNLERVNLGELYARRVPDRRTRGR